LPSVLHSILYCIFALHFALHFTFHFALCITTMISTYTKLPKIIFVMRLSRFYHEKRKTQNIYILNSHSYVRYINYYRQEQWKEHIARNAHMTHVTTNYRTYNICCTLNLRRYTTRWLHSDCFTGFSPGFERLYKKDVRPGIYTTDHRMNDAKVTTVPMTDVASALRSIKKDFRL